MLIFTATRVTEGSTKHGSTHTHLNKHTDWLTSGLLPLLNTDLSHTDGLRHMFGSASCTVMVAGLVYTEWGQIKSQVTRGKSSKRWKQTSRMTKLNLNFTRNFLIHWKVYPYFGQQEPKKELKLWTPKKVFVIFCKTIVGLEPVWSLF